MPSEVTRGFLGYSVRMRLRRRHLAVLSASVAMLLAAAGCAAQPSGVASSPTGGADSRQPSVTSTTLPPAAVEDETVTWLNEQAGVRSARAERRDGRATLDYYVDLDPATPDDALVALTEQVAARLPTSMDPDGDAVVWYALGDGREFSSLGGEFTLEFLLHWRTAQACTISARGGGPETGNRFLTTCPNSQEHLLSSFLSHHINAFGVDASLARPDDGVRFVTRSTDGRFEAESTATTDLGESSNFAFTLKPPIEILSARAVNDGSREQLLLVVPDEETRAQVEKSFEEYPYRDDSLELTVQVAS